MRHDRDISADSGEIEEESKATEESKEESKTSEEVKEPEETKISAQGHDFSQ